MSDDLAPIVWAVIAAILYGLPLLLIAFGVAS